MVGKKDAEYEYYSKRRDELSKIRTDSSNSFDKAILQISMGILAVTMAFLEKVGKPYDGLTTFLIMVSWIGFAFVISLNLLSYHFAKKNMDFKINDLDSRYEIFVEKGSWPEEGFSKYKKLTERCNTWSFITFVIALSIFVIYAGLVHYNIRYKPNKSQEAIMTDKGKGIDKRGQTEISEPKTSKKGQTETAEPVKPKTDKKK